MLLKGKHAVVTGASRGVGRATLLVDARGTGEPSVGANFVYVDTTGDGQTDTKTGDAVQTQAALPVDRPDTLINLRQFRQLSLDCKLLCSSCQMADVGRVFLFSSREDSSPTLLAQVCS